MNKHLSSKLRPTSSAQTNFLDLSKIISIFSNKNWDRISDSIFEKSTKFWFYFMAFDSSVILSSWSKMDKYFVRKISDHPLAAEVLFFLIKSFKKLSFYTV